MATQKLTRGLAVVQYALLGADGAPTQNWRSFGWCDRDNPVTYTESDPTKTEFRAHEKSGAIEVDYEEGERALLFHLLNPTKESRAVLLGGTVTGSGESAVLSIPDDRGPFECAIRILPKQGDINVFNHTLLWGQSNGNWEKSGKSTYQVGGDVLLSHKAGLTHRQEGPDVKSIRGGVATATVLNGGEDYTNGTITDVALFDFSGEGALATIVVADGEVTTVTITSGGKNYHVGTVLTAPDLPGGSGFECVVATVV